MYCLPTWLHPLTRHLCHHNKPTGIMPNSIRSRASTLANSASFSWLSSSASVLAVWWATSACDAARRPADWPPMPKPKY